MDKKINKIIETYVTTYKQAVSLVRRARQDRRFDRVCYGYERLVLKKEEFIKQKRTKNAISNVNRCMAIISSGVNAPANEKNCELCGTHEKATRSGWLIQILYRKPRCTL
jgi:hypothetical protein